MQHVNLVSNFSSQSKFSLLCFWKLIWMTTQKDLPPLILSLDNSNLPTSQFPKSILKFWLLNRSKNNSNLWLSVMRSIVSFCFLLLVWILCFVLAILFSMCILFLFFQREWVRKLRAIEGLEVVCICDDSGSMNTPVADGGGKATGSRWDEMKESIKSIVIFVFFLLCVASLLHSIRILALFLASSLCCVSLPFVSVIVDIAAVLDPKGIDIYFLNRAPLFNMRSSGQSCLLVSLWPLTALSFLCNIIIPLISLSRLCLPFLPHILTSVIPLCPPLSCSRPPHLSIPLLCYWVEMRPCWK